MGRHQAIEVEPEEPLVHGLGVLAGLERELAEELGPERWTALEDALLALDRVLGR